MWSRIARRRLGWESPTRLGTELPDAVRIRLVIHCYVLHSCLLNNARQPVPTRECVIVLFLRKGLVHRQPGVVWDAIVTSTSDQGPDVIENNSAQQSQ